MSLNQSDLSGLTNIATGFSSVYGYRWGVDGLGRAYLFKASDKGMSVVFCTLPNISGMLGAILLSEQDKERENEIK